MPIQDADLNEFKTIGLIAKMFGLPDDEIEKL